MAESVVAEPETVTRLTVDADINKNLVPQDDPETPAGIRGVTFTPVLVEIGRETDS